MLNSLILIGIIICLISMIYCLIYNNRHFIFPILVFAFLLVMSEFLGYPTNSRLPDKFIVYGLTTEQVWIGEKDNPIPRAYTFKTPPEWFEERDRRNGHPFEVEKNGRKSFSQNRVLENNGSIDRPSFSQNRVLKNNGWIILPEKIIKKDD